MTKEPPDFPPFVTNIDPSFQLKVAYSVQDVALALGLDPEKFFYVIQHSGDGSYYKEFKIPKKKGGERLISAPRRGLGLAQTRLADVLQASYKPKVFVKGYVSGESFLTNARYHERQKWILNVDIKDFYPSITFPRVRGLFMSSIFGFNSRVSTILARITTTPNGLPQGARTSPIIANILAHSLDKRLVEIAAKRRLKYTRYADDITFSSSRRDVPSALVSSWAPSFGDRTIQLGSELMGAFDDSGFTINLSKTRLQFSYERQEVTGLVVNRAANVRRKDISRLRMILHSAREYGPENAAAVWIRSDATPEDFWNYVTGWLSYLRQVRGINDAVLAKMCKMAVMSGIKGPDWVLGSADMVREFDVFLSHASEDKPKVRKLKEKLEALEVTVFFDEDSIKWGDSITEKINHGLLTSSFFVPFLSETFSKKGWTNKELNSAIAANVNRKGRILPIKDHGFSIEDSYPLLNETLYKEWPSDDGGEDAFLNEIADELLKVVSDEKAKEHDLS